MKHEVAIPVSIAVLSLAFFIPKVSLAMAPKNPPAPRQVKVHSSPQRVML
jgi:hypothetical protein